MHSKPIQSGTWIAGVLMELANNPRSPLEIMESLYGEDKESGRLVYSAVARLRSSGHVRKTAAESRLMLTTKGRAEADRLRAAFHGE